MRTFILLLSLLFISEVHSVDFGTDYMKAAQYWVDQVYQTIYKNNCKHTPSYPTTYEDIPKIKHMNCANSASITYQQAGMIPKGKIVGHTSAVSSNIISHYDSSDLKKSRDLSFKNVGNLKKGTCDLVKVMKTFEKMPTWLKKKGTMYVQDSNIEISAGDNKIYSCNSSGKIYGSGHVNPKRSSGYPFTSPILWAVVPRTNGKTNVPSDTSYKHLAC